jgi:charged multivesicular body protein 2A
MSWLFGKKKTPAQMMRENQRLLQRAMRDLDRERAAMEKQEQKIIADIKKMAKKNEMGTVKIMAKDLVRTRNTCKKFMLMRANIQVSFSALEMLKRCFLKGVSLKMTTIKSQHAMSEAMKGVTRAMGRMNKQMNLPQIQKIMQQFEKESEIMDMKEEMMNDVMDDAMGDEDDEEESENLVNKVLDELGLENMAEVGAIPSAVGDPTPAQTEVRVLLDK